MSAVAWISKSWRGEGEGGEWARVSERRLGSSQLLCLQAATELTKVHNHSSNHFGTRENVDADGVRLAIDLREEKVSSAQQSEESDH